MDKAGHDMIFKNDGNGGIKVSLANMLTIVTLIVGGVAWIVILMSSIKADVSSIETSMQYISESQKANCESIKIIKGDVGDMKTRISVLEVTAP